MDDSTGLASAADAAYSDTGFTDSTGHRFSGRFRLRANTGSRIWDAIFIHEAVHASFDLTGSRLSLADGEAAAYIASAMFCQLTGLPLVRWRAQMGIELRVRSTALQALRSATISGGSEIDALREELIRTQYYGQEDMGTVASPRFYQGDR